VSPDDFGKLTKIPIQIVFGDNIPTETSPNPEISPRGDIVGFFVSAGVTHGFLLSRSLCDDDNEEQGGIDRRCQENLHHE
jgi:hypothetical protein